MTYMRWPAGTKHRHVPGLQIALIVEREARRRRENYLKFAYPPRVVNSHRNN